MGIQNTEFDTLNHRILSVLINNSDRNKIKGIIYSFLVIDLGFFTTEEEIDSKYIDIINWWENEKN